MSDEEEIIETLEATQGKNEGEAIASFKRSIVFLPRGVTPGQKVRVKLVELGKKDRNERPMYRGEPAPDVSSESWKDNGDGTATKVSISTNWKGEAREVGVLETKALEKRDDTRSWRSEYKISGPDFTSSRVEEVRKYKTALEEQKVVNSAIVWQTVGHRDEPDQIFFYPVKEIRIKEQGDIWTFRFEPSYTPGWTAYVKVTFTKPDGKEEEETIMSSWAELPGWLQSQHEAKFPVCVCGRKRYDRQNPDGYSKCEECRKQEVCARCGKQATVKLVGKGEDKLDQIRQILGEKEIDELEDEATRDSGDSNEAIAAIATYELGSDQISQVLAGNLKASTFNGHKLTLEVMNGKITIVAVDGGLIQPGGRLVCPNCEVYEYTEQLVNTNLTREMLEAIATEAKKLLAGQAMPQADGEAVLRNTLDHLEEFARDHFTRKWAKYNWYYFCNDGIYGCKLAPAALQILQFLPQASGNGLVEMIAWITNQAKPADPDQDYYLRTQVQGEKADIPHLTADMLTKIKLADWLRGSEADRIAAISGHKALVEKLGPEFEDIKAVEIILQETEQDYAAAVAKIREIGALVAASEKGEILLNFGGHFRHMGENDQSDVWVIDPYGREVEAKIDYRKNYRSEGNKNWPIVREDCLVLRWARNQAGRTFFETWEVVKLPKNGVTPAQREAAKTMEPHERFHGPGSGFDLSRVGTNTCSASRDIGADQFDVPARGVKPVPRNIKGVKRIDVEELEEAPDEAPNQEQVEGDDPKSAEDLVKAMNSKWKKF